MKRSGTPAGGEFGEFLKEELLRRCRSNPKYSLRAFGRSLGIEPSALSKLIHGKRSLTPQMFEKLAARLALPPASVEKYRPTGPLRRGRKGRVEPIAVSIYRDIATEEFDLIADWYHFAILELTHVRNFMPDRDWIARVLGITPLEVGIAVERLFTLGYLEKKEDGTWRDCSESVSIAKLESTSAARRELQRQILKKSLVALDEVPIENRSHTSMTMAIDSSKLPEAKRRIQKFQRELCEFLKGDKPPRDRVFHLGVSLYPVSSETN